MIRENAVAQTALALMLAGAMVLGAVMLAPAAYATGAAPKPKPAHEGPGGGGGGGGTGTTSGISCQALRQQVQNSYASAGLSAQVAQSAGARAEQECRQRALVK